MIPPKVVQSEDKKSFSDWIPAACIMYHRRPVRGSTWFTLCAFCSPAPSFPSGSSHWILVRFLWLTGNSSLHFYPPSVVISEPECITNCRSSLKTFCWDLWHGFFIRTNGSWVNYWAKHFCLWSHQSCAGKKKKEASLYHILVIKPLLSAVISQTLFMIFFVKLHPFLGVYMGIFFLLGVLKVKKILTRKLWLCIFIPDPPKWVSDC